MVSGDKEEDVGRGAARVCGAAFLEALSFSLVEDLLLLAQEAHAVCSLITDDARSLTRRRLNRLLGSAGKV